MAIAHKAFGDTDLAAAHAATAHSVYSQLGVETQRASARPVQGGLTKREIEILLGEDVVLGVKLMLGQVSTRVVVVEGSPIVQPTKTGISQVVERSQTLNLPINGRRVDQYVLLTPAVVPDSMYSSSFIRSTETPENRVAVSL
jgi:hypothetical protein